MRAFVILAALTAASVSNAADAPKALTTCAQFEDIAETARKNFSSVNIETTGKIRVTEAPVSGARRCYVYPAFNAARRPQMACQYDLPEGVGAAHTAIRVGEVNRLGALLRKCRPSLIPRKPVKLEGAAGAPQLAYSTRDGSELWFIAATSFVMTGVEIKSAPSFETYRAPAKGLSPEFVARAIVWKDCPGYDNTQDMLRANFAGIETVQSDGREMLKAPLDPMSQCIVSRATAGKPEAVLTCFWTKYGAENQAWAKGEYDRRVKSLGECRGTAKPVFVLPQGRLGSDEQSHFRTADGLEAWSVGYARQGDTWYVELHAYGASANPPPE